MVGYSQSHHRWIVGFCIASFLALPIGVLSVRSYQNEVALRSAGVPTCARITATQHSRNAEVRYAFDVGGETFSHSDATGRSDLWASLTDETWELASAQGCVEVVYLSDDPSVNRPRVQGDRAQHVGGFAFFVLILLLTGGGLLAVVRNARATLWTLVSWDETELVLSDEGVERRVLRSSLKKAMLRTLPPAVAHPPWRFPVDVLFLTTAQDNFLVARGGESWASLLASLETRPGLRRKRAA